MNNKLNTNFSLRKLLLTALVAGPLATLPAPLWALPDISSVNLQKSANVNVSVVGTSQLNVDAPDKAILSWTHFGDTSFYGTATTGPTNTFAFGEVINFFLPTPTSSVLNIVTGNTASRLDGAINSQGNVYFLNPAGIVIGASAQVNTGGFYASAVNEPPGYFSINGSLSYVGTSAGNIVVEGTGTTTSTSTAGNAATIQAVGPGNNIYLAGNAVDVQGGKFFGNLFVRSTSTTNPLTNGSNTGAVSFGSTGPVSVNLTGVPLIGGGLNITTSGGNVVLSGDAARTLTVAGNVSSTTGAVSISTVGSNGLNGNITQGSAAFLANTTGTVVTLNAGTGTTAGNITLPNIDFLTVGSTGKNIVLLDTAGGVTLNSTTASGDLTVRSTSSINQGAGTHSVAGVIDLIASGGNTIAFTGTGNLTFRTLGTTSTVSITTSGDIVLPGTTLYTGTPTITVLGGGGTGAIFTPAYTGGQVSGVTLTSAGTGYTSAPTVIISNGTANPSVITATYNATTGTISGVTFAQSTAGSASATMSVVSTGGSITAGTITSSSTLNLTASQGNITAAAITSGTATFLAGGNVTIAPNAVVTTGSNLRNSGGSTMSVTASAGNISLNAVSSSSTLNLTATAGSITVLGATQSNTLNFTAANGTVTLGSMTLSNSVNITGGTVTIGGTVATSSSLTVTASAGTLSTQGITTSSTLTLNATASGGTITAANITSTTTQRTTLNSNGAISLNTTVVPVLTVNSTTGSITQTNAITSTSSATFNAASDISLTLTTNALNSLVLQGGASATGFAVNTSGTFNGVSTNLFLGTATNAKVATTITANAGTNIVLGNAAIDVITFGSTLNLNTSGAGTILTNANTVNVFGNVNVTTVNSTATIGSNIFGNAANYTFGQINANVGSGALNVFENTTLNLGTISAGTVDARSLSSDIVNTGAIKANTATFSAHDIFTPGNVSLTNAGNAITNIVIGNAKDFTAVNSVPTTLTAGTSAVNGKAATGVVSITVNGANTNSLVINTAAGGDYNVLSFTAPGAVTVTDPNGLTLQNLSNTSANGAAAVSISAAGPIVLGSGINLGGTGLTTITSTYSASNGLTPKISDSAAGVRIFGETIFRSDGAISITNAGHSFGAVNLITTGVASAQTGAAAGSTALQDVVYTEGGTANLKTVSVGTTTYPGSLTVTSTGGGISQAVGGAITVPNAQSAATTVSFTAGAGGVNLSSNTLTATNSITPAVNITATGNSSVTQSAQNLVLGNVTVTQGTFAVDTSSATGGAISQSTGSSIKVYGNVTATTQTGKITLANASNNFGGLTLLTTSNTAGTATAALTATTVTSIVPSNTTVASGYAPNTTIPVTVTGGGGAGATAVAVTNGAGQITGYNVTAAGTGYTSVPTVTVPAPTVGATGADVAIQEQGIMNLLAVNAGTLGKLSATSENASIIQTGTGGLIVGNVTALTAMNGGITLTNNTNAFGGTAFGGGSILVNSTGNVSITDSVQNTVLNGNTTIGGSLALKNIYGAPTPLIAGTSGTIRDTPGTLTVAGPVNFDVGLADKSTTISIGSAVASFGAITFKGGTVTIVENSTLNIGAGSSATGPVSLTSSGSIVTSGTANFQSSLNLNAGGNITISNPIFVQGASLTGPGLIFKALGAVDLSFLSLAGNLNSIAPINNGAASYKAPSP